MKTDFIEVETKNGIVLVNPQNVAFVQKTNTKEELTQILFNVSRDDGWPYTINSTESIEQLKIKLLG